MSLDPDTPLFLCQTIGMSVGVDGIGYGIAALNEQKHFPIVLFGLLGKIFGPIGFIFTFFNGDITLSFVIMIILNDLIWYPAFFGICYRFFRNGSALTRLIWERNNQIQFMFIEQVYQDGKYWLEFR
ncbi:MAG: alkyl hydroperoxide reductase [Balneolaceae bacterium]|nr:MAG: alkyl hydroperoxide reductase [Balneolaceae bacterium]